MLRELEQRFTQLIETLRVDNGAATHAAQAGSRPTEKRNALPPQLTDIEAYVADLGNPTHFEDWLKRFEMSLLCAAANIGDKDKTMVLATKLSADAFAEFRKCCLPKDVTDYTYEETVARLRLLFTKQRSVFADRYDCLRLTRDEGEEFMHFVNRCKASLKRFRFEDLTNEQFKALILLSALKSATDEPLRARILQKLNQDGDQVRFDEIITDCVSFLTTKEDCRVFAKESVQLNAVQKPPQEHRQHRKQQPPLQRKPGTPTARSVPPSPCFRCGDLHWSKDCTHVSHKCNKCKRVGHLESQCGRTHNYHSRNHRPKTNNRKTVFSQVGTVLQWAKPSGLMEMAVRVNEARVKFYLDTGAEVNIINRETFESIGAPALQKCDEVARMYNGQTATFLGKGKAIFQRRNHMTTEVFYVAPRDL